ncbi:MAG: alpha-amylase family protein [Armatimonadota bacterium]
MTTRFLTITLLALLATCIAYASTKVVWQSEAEKVVHPNGMRFGAAIADDEQASGGKAIRMPWQKDSKGWCTIFSTPQLTLQGKCLITLNVRSEGMLPITDGMRVTLVAHDVATGGWAFHNDYPIYGINLKPDGYTTLTLVLNTGSAPTLFRGVEIILEWQVAATGITPVCFLDKVEIATEVPETPVITEVWTGKVRYAPQEKASARVTVQNPTLVDAQLTLVGEELTGLTTRRKVFTLPVALKAGEEKAVTGEWQLGSEEYGREIAVSLLSGDKVVNTASELFAVSKIPLWLSAANGYDRGRYVQDMHTIFYVAPASGQESWRSVKFFKKQSPGGDYHEFFSWSPGDISDLAPQEDPFPGGEGRMTYRSKATIKQQTTMLKSVGMWPLTYVNGTCWADSGYKLFQRHPEWFLYDANGEVGHYGMERRELYRRKDDADFDPNKYPLIYFQATLNHALPEVQEYIAQQYIKTAKEMGFKGVRMDVRYLEVYPGERGFDGKEVAPTYAEADKISAAAVKRVKELVHKEVPDFTFGYNYASPEETQNMRLTMQERCAGGGWMLDEVSCGYQEKTSPYHIWSAYARRMCSWGDQVNKWGGIYNPFDFHRNGTPYVVDNIYSSIFRLIAGGRINCYNNSRLPLGNLGRFATRYSEFFFGHNRSWLPEIKGELEIKSAAPIWWKDMVYWNRNTAGRRQLIVNLVNPPRAAEVEENKLSDIMPPVRNIEVTCAPAEGKSPQAAYLLMAEPVEPTDTPELKMVKLPMKALPGGKVTVTVPSVIFWKMVVFQY